MQKKFFYLFVVLAVTVVCCNKTNTPDPVDNIELDKGLVAFFPFNGNTKDESGNNNDGVIIGGGLSYDEHGYANSAFNSNGNGNKVVVNNNGKIAFDTAFTISYNVMVRNFGRYVFVSMVDNTTGKGVSFSTGTNIPGSRNVTFSISRSTSPCDQQFLTEGTQYMTINQYQIQPESWYNLIFTFNRGSMKMYVNGVQTSSQTIETYSTHICPNAQLIIGGWWNGDAPASINGKIDEVRLYNRVINADEIKELSKHF